MRNTTHHPTHHYIDLAPMGERYELLMASLMAMIEAGRMKAALGVTQTVLRLVHVYTQFDAQNILLRRKMDMLMHKPWRELVLKELGGLRKLELWEAARKRIEIRNDARRNAPAPEEKPSPSPAWLYTPERIAESERLKARVRMCARAAVSPRIFRDPFRVDFEGEFRLAPLLRGPQLTRQIKVYTAQTISDYDWNAMPFQPVKGFGPATVWPAEFYAAMAAEEAVLGTTDNSVISALGCSQREAPMEPEPNLTGQPLEIDPLARGDDKGNKADFGGLPTLQPHQLMSEKDHVRVFGERTLGDCTA